LFEGFEPSDDPSSRQTDDSLEKMHKIIHEDRRLRLTKFVTFQAYLYDTCWCILPEDWNMKWISEKFVPHVLNDSWKQNQVSAWQDLQDQDIKPNLAPCDFVFSKTKFS
jgi:hypothetical protein